LIKFDLLFGFLTNQLSLTNTESNFAIKLILLFQLRILLKSFWLLQVPSSIWSFCLRIMILKMVLLLISLCLKSLVTGMKLLSPYAAICNIQIYCHLIFLLYSTLLNLLFFKLLLYILKPITLFKVVNLLIIYLFIIMTIISFLFTVFSLLFSFLISIIIIKYYYQLIDNFV
jgi:hypothetical protein